MIFPVNRSPPADTEACAPPGRDADPGVRRAQRGRSADYCLEARMEILCGEFGADGVRAISWTSSSYVNARDCIFADNAGEGIRVENANMSCTESYNVFVNGGIQVNGAPQALASPAYESASDGDHRGAYQEVMIPAGTIFLLK